MALGGTFDSRAVTTITADNRDYLRAVQQIERADEQAARKRDAAIVKTLKAQGELTQAAFQTAKAVVDSGGAWEGITKNIGGANKALDLVTDKVKAFGKGLLSGALVGFGVGVLGGSISSLVQQALAPPTDEELEQLAKYGNGIAVAAEMTKAWAKAELERKAVADDIKAGNKLVDEIKETMDHANALRELSAARGQLDEKYKVGAIDVEVYTAILEKLRLKEEDVLGITERRTKAWNDQVQVLLGGVKQINEALAYHPHKGGGQEDYRIHGPNVSVSKESQFDPIAMVMAARQDIQREALGRALGADQTGLSDGLDAAKSALQDIQGIFQDVADERKKNPHGLADMLGTPEDFTAFNETFNAFTGAAGAAFSALIDGSESAGKAFTKFLAGSLKAEAVHAAVEALKEGAWALGSLAIGDAKGAALHGASAGKWALVAAAAGAGAAALGGGGGAAPTGAYGGGGGGGTSGGGGGSGGTSTTVVVYGDPFASANPRDRQRYAREMVQAGLHGKGGSGIVDG